jgi:hypothetical protein
MNRRLGRAAELQCWSFVRCDDGQRITHLSETYNSNLYLYPHIQSLFLASRE